MDSYLCLLVLIGIIGATAAGSNYCPPREYPSPCSCFHGVFYGGNGTRVQCSFINSAEILYNEVQKLKGYPVDYFNLVHSMLPYLPPGLFSGTTVRRIKIEGTTLQNLYSIKQSKPSPFDGLENSLEEISIQFVSDPSKWFWPEMKNMTHLKSFEINMSPVDFVGHNFAEIGGGSLETIAVTYAGVNRIHPQAFPELKNLKQAIFSGNNIPYLVRTMFPDPATKLELINFSGNKLFTLNENMFENMPALKFLDFTQNKFKTFESTVFKPVWNQLQYFYTSVNPYRCDCSLIPLQQELISGSHPPYQDLEQVTCSNPGDLEKTKLRDLDGKSMHC